MPLKNTTAKPVPPDCMRVWRGFINTSLQKDIEKFYTDLGEVFVPATVIMQWRQGLDAYVPSFLASKEKPANIPDETAILSWDSQIAYKNGFNTLAIRTYSLTHGAVYNTAKGWSTADFPLLFAGKFELGQSYYFFTEAIDWMQGTVFHLVGGRPPRQTPKQFVANVQAWAINFQKTNPDKAAGAIICITNDYVVFWECIPKAKRSGKGMDALAALCTVHHNKAAEPAKLTNNEIYANWVGMTVKHGDSFNMQFDRRDITD